MRVVFRVDASLSMGAGHAMRCLTLANRLKEEGDQVIFICRELPGNLIQLIKQSHFVATLPLGSPLEFNDKYLNWLGSTQEQDAQETIQVLPKDVDILIVDNYALDKKWHAKLRHFVERIMVIDDLIDRQFDCDILLNQNLGVRQQDYHGMVPKNCQLLLGCQYALLRPEFKKIRNSALYKRKNTKKIRSILLSLGGGDQDNLTYSILKNIGHRFDITVALRQESLDDRIKKYARKRPNIHLALNTENMSKLMMEADLAIGAGGSTSWERCCLGLPTLLFITAENQNIIAKNLENLGAVRIVGNLKLDLDFLVNNFPLWHTMSLNSQKICDGLGTERVIANVK